MTQSFEFTIYHCSDSIEDFGDSQGCLFFISHYTRSDYRKIRVLVYDQKKFDFFNADGKRKCFVVMLFGPKNTPAFYTAMMKVLRDDWVVLLNEIKHRVPSDVSITNIVCDRKRIIDDMLIYSNYIDTLFHYFFCVANVFAKY